MYNSFVQYIVMLSSFFSKHSRVFFGFTTAFSFFMTFILFFVTVFVMYFFGTLKFGLSPQMSDIFTGGINVSMGIVLGWVLGILGFVFYIVRFILVKGSNFSRALLLLSVPFTISGFCIRFLIKFVVHRFTFVSCFKVFPGVFFINSFTRFELVKFGLNCASVSFTESQLNFFVDDFLTSNPDGNLDDWKVYLLQRENFLRGFVSVFSHFGNALSGSFCWTFNSALNHPFISSCVLLLFFSGCLCFYHYFFGFSFPFFFSSREGKVRDLEQQQESLDSKYVDLGLRLKDLGAKHCEMSDLIRELNAKVVYLSSRISLAGLRTLESAKKLSPNSSVSKYISYIIKESEDFIENELGVSGKDSRNVVGSSKLSYDDEIAGIRERLKEYASTKKK